MTERNVENGIDPNPVGNTNKIALFPQLLNCAALPRVQEIFGSPQDGLPDCGKYLAQERAPNPPS